MFSMCATINMKVNIVFYCYPNSVLIIPHLFSFTHFTSLLTWLPSWSLLMQIWICFKLHILWRLSDHRSSGLAQDTNMSWPTPLLTSKLLIHDVVRRDYWDYVILLPSFSVFPYFWKIFVLPSPGLIQFGRHLQETFPESQLG